MSFRNRRKSVSHELTLAQLKQIYKVFNRLCGQLQTCQHISKFEVTT